MNRKGFTLIELLAVIIIIAIIMDLVMPSATRVSQNNKKRIYEEYENMMIEYAKVSALNYENSIDLVDLAELEKVKNECSGYVLIDHSVVPPVYTAYLTCGDQYTTNSYNPNYAKTIIPIPVCKSGLVYDGNNQELIVSKSTYTITNGTRKNAGLQDVTVSIVDPSNYVWADNSFDDKIIKDCEIGKREVTIKADNKTMSYGDSAPTYTYTVTNNVGDENPLSGSVSYSIVDTNNNAITINSSTPIGIYSIKPSASASSNYTLKLEDGVIILLRSVIDVPTCASKEYNGLSQTLFEAHTSGTYTNTAITGIDVGSYSGTLTQNNNYQWNNDNPNSSVSITCSITPKSVPVVWGSTTTFTYNGNEQSPTASATGVTGETINLIKTGATNVSSTSYTSTATCDSVTGGRESCNNYELTNTTKEFTINKATNPISVTATQSWNPTFSTSSQTKGITAATNAEGSVSYAINSQPTGNYFSISGTTLTMAASTPVGTYSVVIRATAAGNDNYNSGYKDITMTVTVDKADAVCPTISDWTGPYDGSQHSIIVSGGSGGSIQYKWQTTSDSWRDVIPTASIVGTFITYVQMKGDTNHNTVDCSYKTLTINKATNPISVTTPQTWTPTFSTSSQTKAITAATNAQGSVSYAINSQPTGSYFSISGTTLTMAANTPAGTYSVVIRATAAGNDNYNSGYKDITMTVTVGKATGYINLSTTTGSIAYGTASASCFSVSSSHGGTLSVTDNNSTATCSISGTAVSCSSLGSLAAGTTVTVTATSAATNNYTAASKTYTLTVNKATNPISVTASQTKNTTFPQEIVNISFTGASNAQGSVTYAIQSQKNSSGTSVSSFSIPTNTTASVRMAANTASGTYTVVVRATAAGNSNYNSGYKDITLTIVVPVIRNLTYSYQENNAYTSSMKYMDTKYTMNWNIYQEIGCKFKIPSQGSRYLIIGNYDGSKNINIEVNSSNKLRLYINNGGVDVTSSVSIPANTQVQMTFKWHSASNTYELTATASGMTSISLTGTYDITGTSGKTFRTNNDHRSSQPFSNITINSLYIKETRDNGTVISSLPSPSKSGKTFNGWYTDSSGGSKVTSVTLNSTQTIYARWS